MTQLTQNRGLIATWRAAGSPRLTRAQLAQFRKNETVAGYRWSRVRQRGDWIEGRDRFGDWVRVCPIPLAVRTGHL
jgi:hypothetical protein